jgi:hypothetical protein
MQMNRIIALSASAVLVFSSFALPSSSEPIRFFYSGESYSNVAVPGSVYTEATGINNAGQIVGGYSGGGFLYSGGTYTTLSVPLATFSSAHSINNVSQIVEYYVDRSDLAHGFLQGPTPGRRTRFRSRPDHSHRSQAAGAGPKEHWCST